MRLISWNCNGGFRKKATLLLQYEPDILVVPECENPSCYAFPVEMTEHYSSYWTGASAPKGLGLFVKKPLSPQSPDTLSPFRDFLPLRLKNCNLIGVWTHKPGYIEDVYDLLSTQHELIGQRSILAGDFNSNSIWDRSHGAKCHSAVVRLLNNRGLVSVWHAYHSEEQGKETVPTYFHRRNPSAPFHIDYCFTPPSWIGSVSIGAQDEWLSLSDHMPLILDLNIP